jgi:hypothetical protein
MGEPSRSGLPNRRRANPHRDYVYPDEAYEEEGSSDPDGEEHLQNGMTCSGPSLSPNAHPEGTREDVADETFRVGKEVVATLTSENQALRDCIGFLEKILHEISISTVGEILLGLPPRLVSNSRAHQSDLETSTVRDAGGYFNSSSSVNASIVVWGMGGDLNHEDGILEDPHDSQSRKWAEERSARPALRKNFPGHLLRSFKAKFPHLAA